MSNISRPVGVAPPLPVDISFNKFAVGRTRDNVSILAPSPVYNRESALNLVCWLAVIAGIEPDEVARGMNAIISGKPPEVFRKEG